MCRQLGVSPSSYYRWCRACPSARDTTDAELTTLITHHFTVLSGNPGVRRMRAELAATGHRVGHKRVWRLMRAAGLQGRHPRAWKRTTVPGENPVSAADLIGRDFTAAKEEPEVVRRYHVYQDVGGVGLRGDRDRSVFAEGRGLGGGHAHAYQSRDGCAGDGDHPPQAAWAGCISF